MTEQMMWQPTAERVAAANRTAFAAQAGIPAGSDYAALQRWSVEQPEAFWSQVWDFCDVRGEKGTRILIDGDRMAGARWFPEARLNYAQNLLRRRDYEAALVFWGEDKLIRRMGWGDLYRRVARLAAAMRDAGIRPGDVVAAYMPNMPETLITLLATASLGAVFTSAAPDFGVQRVLDQFGQVSPKLLFVADGYYYDGQTFDSLDRVKEIVAGLPALKKTVVARYTRKGGHALADIPQAVMLREFVDPYRWQTEIEFVRLPFNHPLLILYSAGATGRPECIVHGAGGVLLQHLKEQRLQADIKPGDKVFCFTTCGGMVWNWLASALACEATVLLYDGAPCAGRGSTLFDYAVAEGMTHFGTPATFIDACAKQALKPRVTHDLAPLRVMFSTDGPLSPEGLDYVCRDIKPDLQFAAISGAAAGAPAS